MDTTAPTIRALELKEQQHRADVAELVAVLRRMRSITQNFIGSRACDDADALIAKHGA